MVGNIPTRVDDGSWLLSVVTLGPILHLTVGLQMRSFHVLNVDPIRDTLSTIKVLTVIPVIPGCDAVTQVHGLSMGAETNVYMLRNIYYVLLFESINSSFIVEYRRK